MSKIYYIVHNNVRDYYVLQSRLANFVSIPTWATPVDVMDLMSITSWVRYAVTDHSVPLATLMLTDPENWAYRLHGLRIFPKEGGAMFRNRPFRERQVGDE